MCQLLSSVVAFHATSFTIEPAQRSSVEMDLRHG
jgi:hypothetical protein